MAVRRELDDDTNTISLGTLLDEMAERPDVLTRRRYLAFMPQDKPWLTESNDMAFTSRGVIRPTADPMDDYIDPARIRHDRESLNATARSVLEYANQIVAHRSPVKGLDLTVAEIHAALDAMEPVLKKYYVLMTGNALVQVEPANVGDGWRDVFAFPWREAPARG